MCGRDVPWKHYNERCFRTMKNLPGAKSLCPPHDGTQHNALVDARQQALWLVNMLRHTPSYAPPVDNLPDMTETVVERKTIDGDAAVKAGREALDAHMRMSEQPARGE